MIKKIISGGQTGIDRMGLEVAHRLGIETGGVAPIEFITEDRRDFVLEDVFGLRAITPEENEQYIQLFNRNRKDRYVGRTCINVRDSDGTVIFATHRDSPGTKLTKEACEYYWRPYIVNPNIDSLTAFIQENNIETLNVAGNRGSRLSRRDRTNFETILYETLKTVISREDATDVSSPG